MSRIKEAEFKEQLAFMLACTTSKLIAWGPGAKNGKREVFPEYQDMLTRLLFAANFYPGRNEKEWIDYSLLALKDLGVALVNWSNTNSPYDSAGKVVSGYQSLVRFDINTMLEISANRKAVKSGKKRK